MDNIDFHKDIDELVEYLALRKKQLDFDKYQGINVLNSRAPQLSSDFTFVQKETELNAVIAKVAHTMTTELKLYKNDFKTQLVSFIDKAKEKLSNTTDLSHAGKFHIAEVDVPDILKEAKDLDILNSTANMITIMDYTDIPQIPSILIDNIEIKDKAINRYAVEMLTVEDLGNPDKYLVYLYNLPSMLSLKDAIYYSTDLVKAWFLGLYILEQRLPETGVPLPAMKSMLWKIENVLSYIVTQYKSYVEQEKLFMAYNNSSDDPTVYVLKPVWDSLDNEVGMSDAIFGLAVKRDRDSDPLSTYKQNVLANKQSLMSIWENYVVISKEENPVRRRNRLRSTYIHVAQEVLEELPEDLYGYCSYGNNTPLIAEGLEECLNKTPITDTGEYIEKLAIDFIGGILFNLTNYHKFLVSSSKHLEKNHKLTMDQVLPLVITELVTEYYLGHLKVFDIK